MKQTKEFVQHIAGFMENRLSWLTRVKWIGRQDPTGVITDGEEFIGLDDANGNEAYIRYATDVDHVYSTPAKRLTSAPTQRVTANLRLVLLHKCDNEDDIEAAIWNEMLMAPLVEIDGAGGQSPDFALRVVRSSKDMQAIYYAETKRPERTTNTAVKLMSFDFEVSYNRVATIDPACIPPCNGC